jgi:signal transduction histidine kinase
MDLRGALPDAVGNRRGRRVDLLLFAVSLTGGLLMYAIGQYNRAHPALPSALLLVPMLVCSGALLLRRTAPLMAVLVGTVGVAVDLVLGPSLATVLIFTQVLYDACVHGRPWLYRTLLAAAVALAVVTGAASLAIGRDLRALSLAVLVGIVTVIPVLTGIEVRHHRDRAKAERQRAEQVQRLAELDRANAVASERARMARELHDVIANHLSAVAIHSTAALTVPGLGEAGVRQALTVIRENSVRGLAEMRQMIEFLRDPTGAADPDSPGLGAVPALLIRSERAGLASRLSVRGEPGELPVAVDLAAYRIVQESLTNALKHGGAGPTEVEIGYEPGQLVVTASSPMPPDCGPGVRGLDGGAGVVGMRERALLLGGEFEAGPRDGRWLVCARLPIGAEPR